MRHLARAGEGGHPERMTGRRIAHRGAMAPGPTPERQPGDMTVPPTFGWEDIASVLLLVSAVALVFLLLGAAVATLSGRSEWQGYLGARSRRLEDGAREPDVAARD
jgi:hypothetical protein